MMDLSKRSNLIPAIDENDDLVDTEMKKVLVVFATPKDVPSLRLGTESKLIEESLQRSRYRDFFSVEVRHAATIHDVRRALLDVSYWIIHISCHGTKDGRLVLENEMGSLDVVPEEAFAEILASNRPECVLLNACYSLRQGEILAKKIPHAICIDGPIQDNVSQAFSRGFYDALGAGKSIPFAYAEGRRTVGLLNLRSPNIPRLLSQTSEGSDQGAVAPATVSSPAPDGSPTTRPAAPAPVPTGLSPPSTPIASPGPPATASPAPGIATNQVTRTAQAPAMSTSPQTVPAQAPKDNVAAWSSSKVTMGGDSVVGEDTSLLTAVRPRTIAVTGSLRAGDEMWVRQRVESSLNLFLGRGVNWLVGSWGQCDEATVNYLSGRGEQVTIVGYNERDISPYMFKLAKARAIPFLNTAAEKLPKVCTPSPAPSNTHHENHSFPLPPLPPTTCDALSWLHSP
ncbi:putative tetratricopeptide repeat protein [Paratrimastix pyriformis]|uniref:Tetratricopeptide repeat protein n=1 Tax=Paratrimastix pyriformis TaxID=342808 RepID=A0ABQ8UHF6_9EUKA|nr:putative tetratricopeptide repeat protein [Paratrimastix pyriformis]